MITLPDNLDGHDRADLIKWVVSTGVVIPPHVTPRLLHMWDWCYAHMGEPRVGNILREAQEGWLDYFDGDWQSIMNPFAPHEELCVWFADRDDLTAFVVTWM